MIILAEGMIVFDANTYRFIVDLYNNNENFESILQKYNWVLMTFFIKIVILGDAPQRNDNFRILKMIKFCILVGTGEK